MKLTRYYYLVESPCRKLIVATLGLDDFLLRRLFMSSVVLGSDDTPHLSVRREGDSSCTVRSVSLISLST